MAWFLFLFTAAAVGTATGCEIELLLSSTTTYRSVVSSQRFSHSSPLEIEIPSILLSSPSPATPINAWQLQPFLVPYHKNYAAYLFSISSLLPVSSSPSCLVDQPSLLVQASGDDNKVPTLSEDLIHDLYSHPHTSSLLYSTLTTNDIPSGEILTRQHFQTVSRETTRFVTNDPSQAHDLQRHCLTDIEVGLSRIPKAGRGIFAKKSFRQGEVITVSPMFILPRHEVERTVESSLLMNYCLVSNRTDVALLPATQIALMNHGGKFHSNVKMRWTGSPDPSVSAEAQHKLLSWSPKSLENESNPPLSLFFIAEKDITVGEELLIDYGAEWERKWREYLTELQQWIESHSSSGLEILHKPQFRSFISAPEELFPSQWDGVCIGTTPCVTKEEEETQMLEYHQLIEDALRFHFQMSLSQEILVDSEG